MSANEPPRLDRRAFAQIAGGALAASAVGWKAAAAAASDAFAAWRGRPVSIGMLIFPQIDQIDFTGPFEVLVRIPNATVHVLAKTMEPVRDHKGLILTPERTIADRPPLDLLVVPGGPGQEALMEDESVLALIRDHAAAGKPLFSVCTGALICGAAGLLKGRRATTHWAAFHLLPFFGAVPVNHRVVVDGNLVTAAGVTSGLDGALTVASLLSGDQAAQQIQLDIQYAPEPPFHAGTPAAAPREVVEAVKARYAPLTSAREATARRIAARLGVGFR